jgi:hypothetical protein
VWGAFVWAGVEWESAGLVVPCRVQGQFADQVAGVLVEDLTDRTVARCVPLLARDDVPEHVRSLTSRHVLNVEADLLARLAGHATSPG